MIVADWTPAHWSQTRGPSIETSFRTLYLLVLIIAPDTIVVKTSGASAIIQSEFVPILALALFPLMSGRRWTRLRKRLSVG